MATGVRRLVQECAAITEDRRLDERIPFRTSALLKPKGDFAWMPVYTRDISRTGMGFTHSMPIEQGEVTVMFQTPSGERITFEARVVWCGVETDNTYISGARFDSAQILDPED